MKRQSKNMVLMLAVAFIVVLAGIFVGKKDVQAATTEYVKVFGDDYKDGETVKCGKYYFKKKFATVYISKKKKSGFKELNFPEYELFDSSSIVTNGKTIIYEGRYFPDPNEPSYDEIVVCKYNINTGTVEKLHTFRNWTESGDICGVYKNKILFQIGIDDVYKIYSYNVDTNKWTKAASGYEITEISGKYVLLRARKTYPEPTYTTMRVGKIDSSGKIKMVKTLKKNTDSSASIIGNKVYSATFPNAKKRQYWLYDLENPLGTNDLRKAVIYSCNLDGTGYKKLGTITCPDGKGIGIAKFTSKYCVYYEGVRDYTGNTIYNYTYYKYTYSTKTKKKISKKEYYKLMGI